MNNIVQLTLLWCVSISSARAQEAAAATVPFDEANQVKEATSLPPAFHLNDDVQYFPPGPQFKLTEQGEAARNSQPEQQQSAGLPSSPATSVPMKVIVTVIDADARQSEVVKKMVAALEEAGIANSDGTSHRTLNRTGITAQIAVRHDEPKESIVSLVKALQMSGVRYIVFDKPPTGSHNLLQLEAKETVAHDDLVRIEKAVRDSAKESGLQLVIANDIPRVPAGEYAPAPESEIKAFSLQYSQAAETVALLKDLFSDSLFRVSADMRTNCVIAVGSAKQLNIVEALLVRLDEAPKESQAPIAPVEDPEPEIDQLRHDYSEADRRARSLAATQQKSPDLKRRAELRAAVQRAFKLRQNLLRAELREMQTRLIQTQRSIDMREQIASQIVDRRVEDLLNPQLDWEDLPPSTESSRSSAEDQGSTKTELDGDWHWNYASDGTSEVNMPNPNVTMHGNTWSSITGTKSMDMPINVDSTAKTIEFTGEGATTYSYQLNGDQLILRDQYNLFKLTRGHLAASKPGVTEVEGEWHRVSHQDSLSSPSSMRPYNRTFRKDRSIVAWPGGGHECRIQVNSEAKTIWCFSNEEDGSFSMYDYELKDDQLILHSNPKQKEPAVFERGHVRIPSVVPTATEEQEMLWRSAVVQIVVSGKTEGNMNGPQKIGFGVIVRADGTMVSHLGGGWDNVIDTWPNIDARFDDGSVVPLEYVESAQGLVLLRTKEKVNLNHHFPLSRSVTGIGDEVYVGRIAPSNGTSPDNTNALKLSAIKAQLSKSDRRVAKLGVPVWQLKAPHHPLDFSSKPVISKDGELLGITMAGTGNLLLAVPVAQLQRIFPQCFEPPLSQNTEQREGQ